MSEVKLTLIENSHSFLCEALEKAVLAEKDAGQWKFAIFNMVQAIELLLKEKLRREHPILIYKDVDNPKRTVSLELAWTRLQTIAKIDLDASDLKDIKTASDWRNRIVHFEYEFRAQELKLVFSKLLGFAAHFHDKFLDARLDTIIPETTWDEALKILAFSSALYERAKKKIDERKIEEHLIWRCRNCGFDAFVVQDDENVCYVCGKCEEVIECEHCHEVIFYDEAEVEPIIGHHGEEVGEKYYCRSCHRDMIVDCIHEGWDR